MDSETRRPQRRSSTDLADPKHASREQPETKIEELLLQGEALLRAGRYQQAIHVWTRILFLDRGNPVARDSIEEAKRMLAERQRELDVMVLDAARYLRDGQRQTARKLLSQILLVDPRHTEGRGLWEKLEALERRGEAPSLSLASDLDSEASPRRRRKANKVRVRVQRSNTASPLKMTAFLFCALCLLALGGLYLHLNWDFLVSDSAFATTQPVGAEALGERDAPPLPTLSELHYYNGARLYAKGKHREALSELERVDRQSGVFEEARSLVLRIEERLLRDAITAEGSPSDAQAAEVR